jgi:deazaflavin-dependent oxidoreductase (nitroreductase family)
MTVQQTLGGEGRRRPGLLLRWFYRAPTLLYRIGLGWLMFGQLQLTTVGRKSGRPRQAVVDVLGHDSGADVYYVLSAYGDTSDWYRNLQANPKVDVRVGWRRFPARAATLSHTEAEALFLDFWRRHRLYVRTMFRLIGLRASTEEEARAAVSEMKLVAIQPAGDDG